MTRRRWLAALATGAIALLVVAVSWLLFRPGDDIYSVRGVIPLADGTLLFVEREGWDDSIYDSGRLRVIARDGRELRRGKPVEKALIVRGLAADRLWIQSYEGGLEAWSPTQLAPIPGARAAIEAHPMVARKHQVVGLTERAVVVRAADDRLYTIDADYRIAQQAKDFAYRAIPPLHDGNDAFPVSRPGTRHRVGDAEIRLDQTDLVRPALLTGPEREPIVAGNPPGLLVYSIDFDGVGSSAIVSLVEPASRVRWSVSLRDVVGPNDLGKDAGYRLAYAELRDGVLWVVAEGNVYHRPPSGGRRYGKFDIRLAEIDPTNGSVRSSRAIAVPE